MKRIFISVIEVDVSWIRVFMGAAPGVNITNDPSARAGLTAEHVETHEVSFTA